jgi:hypothetical protein
MFIDSSLEMADGVDFFMAQGGPTKKGSAINIRSRIGDNATIDLSAGEPLYVVIEITTAWVGSGASVNIQLTTADNEALTTNPVNIWETGSEGIADLVVGKRWIVNMPEHDYKAWLGLRITVGSADTTAGAMNVYLAKDVSNWTSTDTRT